MSTAKPSPQPTAEQVEELTLRMPHRAMKVLRQMAAHLDMSCDALVRRYVSRGLREDRAAYFRERAFPAIEESLRAEFGDDPRLDAALRDAKRRLAEDAPPMRVDAAND